MKRLNKEEILIIENLAKNGKSLNIISKKLNLNKSAVYYWFKKFKGRTNSDIKINNELNEEIGEIVGAFAGDGNYYADKNYCYKIRIYLSPNEMWYANHLSNLFLKVFNRKGWIWRDKKGNLILFRILGKEIILHIKRFLAWHGKKTYSVHLKDIVESYDENFLVGFVRGLFLTDGWANKTKGTLHFGTTSRRLFINFLEILTIRNINFYSYDYRKPHRKKLFYLTIPKSDVHTFIEAFKIKEVLPAGISGKAF